MAEYYETKDLCNGFFFLETGFISSTKAYTEIIKIKSKSESLFALRQGSINLFETYSQETFRKIIKLQFTYVPVRRLIVPGVHNKEEYVSL